jgi:hypothetical protein
MGFFGPAVPLAVLSGILVGGASPARASGDELVLRASRIDWVAALDGTLVYRRLGPRGQRRRVVFGRVVGGRLLPARGIPRGAYGDAIGRGRDGRVVLTMGVSQRRKGGSSAVDWWIYDVARDRARRLRGLRRGGCDPHSVSVWRSRLAYAASCGLRSRTGVFLRDGDRTRRVARLRDGYPESVLLRGDTLVALLGASSEETAVLWRLVEDGKVCRTQITDSFLPLEQWGYAGLWLVGDTLMWWVMNKFSGPPGTLVGTRLGDCGEPGPTGTFAMTSPPPRSARARVVDGRWLYYADRAGIRRQLLPARPETDPPPNDDFEHAEPLVGDPPFSRTPTIGNATLQPGEPPLSDSSTGTIWYAFQPITTQRVGIYGAWAYGVFEGTDLPSLTKVGEPIPDDYQYVDGIAGRTYWIALGCRGFRCYVGSTLELKQADSAPPTPSTAARP